ncbi:TPA: hypothetical protein ACH3X1_001101 [Trebouxia sp. C0004]
MLGAAERRSWLFVCEPDWHCSTGQRDIVLALNYQIGLLPSGVGTALYSTAEKTPAQMSFDASSVVVAAGSASALYCHLLAAVRLASRSASNASAEEAEVASVVVGLLTQPAMVVGHALPDAELSKAFPAPVVSRADVADSSAALAAAWGKRMTAVADADWHILLISPSGDLTGALVVCEGVGARQRSSWEVGAVSRVGKAAAAILMHTPCY